MGPAFYKQAKLAKHKTVQTAWLPEKFAKKGRVVRIKGDDGWDDGWHVVEVYATRLDEHVVHEQAHNHRCFPSIDFAHKK
jgi:hypothetical protein